jgi:lipopolysaccharide export system permease protein
VNSELVIPRIASKLSYEKSDPDGEKEIEVRPGWETNGILIEGKTARRRDLVVREFNATIPVSISGNVLPISAAEARYVPPGSPGERSGGWLLTGAQPVEIEKWEHPEILVQIDKGKYFLFTKEVDFEALTRHPKWFQLASTWRLFQELQRPDSPRIAQLAVLFHMRLTRPLLGMILVCMGLAVILTDQNRNVFISAGLCLLLCSVFFAGCFACKQLGDNDMISPALAAWLPLLFFGPPTLAMFDAVHT